MKIVITILLMFFLNNNVFAQRQLTISYDESLNLGEVPDDIQFYITGLSENVHLNGNSINNYVFKTPGNYKVQIVDEATSEKDKCHHNTLPKEILLTVSRIKMTFEENNISFSSPIRKNKDTSKITLSVPVYISTYDHQPVVLNKTRVKTSGIGTNITATLDDSLNEIGEGRNILKYRLKGKVVENSYIMFDFIDANSKIQSVSLVTPIEN